MMAVDDFGAFVPQPRCRVAPLAAGALDGLEFVVKDLIDVAGTVTGAGNPDWAARQLPACRSATAVTRLLAAGGLLTGKTITDELAFSLEGENAHYGTPVNPRCPDRLPGGSSSGSAVAVAAGLADLALGTDTGGSIRVPASFCGVYGYRPSHGRVPLDGVVPFAPEFDTVGLFAGEAEALSRGALALLGSERSSVVPLTLHFAADAMALVGPDCAAIIEKAARTLGATSDVALFAGAPGDFLEAYRVLQATQIAQALGPFLRTGPRFGSAIAPRFASVFDISEAEVTHWTQWRSALRHRLQALLPAGHFLVLPTTPGFAPKRYLRGSDAESFYVAALTLNAAGSLAGLPVVTVPVARHDAYPLGVSVMAGAGQDEALLAFVSHSCRSDESK